MPTPARSSSPTRTVAPARPAATVVLLRERDDPVRDSRFELLMLRRHAAAEFAGDAWVFPGGAVDAADRTVPEASWEGIDPAARAERFEAPAADVLGFHVAAARETFEESGLLLAHAAGDRGDRGRRGGDAVAPGPARADLAAARRRVAEVGFHDWLAGAPVVLDLGRLVYLSRWVTPTASPKRFDTCFFVARAPQGQDADHDRVETVDRRWVTPARALAAHRRGEWALMYPTRLTLEHLAAVPSVADVLAQAGAQPRVRRIQPHLQPGPGGPRLIHPDDPDYPRALYERDARWGDAP